MRGQNFGGRGAPKANVLLTSLRSRVIIEQTKAGSMTYFDSLFAQALTFSSAAAVIVIISTWWLYLSPMRLAPSAVTQPSPLLANWIGVLLSLWAIQLVGGAFWDASMHIQTGGNCLPRVGECPCEGCSYLRKVD